MGIVGLNVGPNEKSRFERLAKWLILKEPTTRLELVTY
jgi:hypothetical protein